MAAQHPHINRFIVSSLPQRAGQQKALAQAVGVAEPTVSRWLKFETSPKPELWPALARFFHVDDSEFEAMAAERAEPGVEVFSDLAQLNRAAADLMRRVALIETAMGGRDQIEADALARAIAADDLAYAARTGEDTAPGDPGSPIRGGGAEYEEPGPP